MSSSDSKPTGGKYVPPHLRKKMDEEAARGNNDDAPPRNDRWVDDSRDRRDGRDYRDNRDSYRDSYRSGGYSRGGYSSDKRYGGYSSSRSETGTGWDVRDGRRYYREYEDDVFIRSEEIRSGINFDSYENIPVEFTGPEKDRVVPIETFPDIKCHSLLLENVKRMQYLKPTPVQKYSIPSILGGRDLMACAQTGSGKTAAFLFPVIAGLLDMTPPESEGRFICPVALIFAPTRELAQQIYDEAKKWCFGTGLRACALYGGTDMRQQKQDCLRGCDICVATPGRLNDYVDRRYLSLRQVKYVVFDEADRMLDMGFEPQIRKLVEEEDLPSKRDRQTVMFSATFPNQIQRLAADFLHDYLYLTVGRVGSTHEFITQTLMYVEENDKEQMLLHLLDKQDPDDLVLVFVETKRKADELEHRLNREKFYATSIHGDRTQEERDEALRYFKSGRFPILVATDVAARGLNIPRVKMVINYDLPSNADDYVHRIGRTGRAGNTGNAISFVNHANRPILRDLQQVLSEADQEIPGWFSELVRTSSYGFGKGGRGGRGGRGGYGGGGFSRGGNNFGGRDDRGFASAPREERNRDDWGGRGGGNAGGARKDEDWGRGGSAGGRDAWD